MKINDKTEVIDPSFTIITPKEWFPQYAEIIEKCGRNCYKSEHRITETSAPQFIKNAINRKHLSIIEHLSITVEITCSRSCSHQLVRHRLGSYSMESQRYINYAKKGYKVICPEHIFDNSEHAMELLRDKSVKLGGMKFVDELYSDYNFEKWKKQIISAIDRYEDLLSDRIKPEDARSVLPNAMATTVITTYNLSQWRHVFEERALNKSAQKEIRTIMKNILRKFNELLPDFFEDQFNLLEK